MSEKTCRKCGNSYPANLEYFPPCKQVKSGLHAWCRTCFRERNRVEMRARYHAKKMVALEDRESLALPVVRSVRKKMKDGVVRVRFGMGFKAAHDACQPAHSSGFSSCMMLD